MSAATAVNTSPRTQVQGSSGIARPAGRPALGGKGIARPTGGKVGSGGKEKYPPLQGKGRGVGASGLGVGRAQKRHRKLLKDNIYGISRSVVATSCVKC